MKKITLILTMLFFVGFSWLGNAQYLTEDFEGGTSLPAGWTNNDITGNGEVWYFDNPGGVTVNSPVSGNFAIFDSDFNGSGPAEEAALESPAFDTSAATTVLLKFDHYFRSGWGGAYDVEVFNGNVWVSVLSGSATSTTNAQSENIDISTHVVGISNAQVRFRWTGNFSWYWAVDNIVVEEAPACLDVTNLNVSNMTAGTPNTIDIAWTGAAGAVNYNWEIQPQGVAVGTAGAIDTGIVADPATNDIASNLVDNTTYTLYVQSDCGGGSLGNWFSLDFHFAISTPDCPTLTYPANGETDVPSNVIFQFSPAVTGNPADSFDFYLGDSITNLTNIGNVTGTSVTVSGLILGQTYFWSVDPVNSIGATDCSATVYSFTVIAPPAGPQGVTCTGSNSPGIIYSEELDSQGLWTGNIGSGNGLWNFGTSTGSSGTGATAPQSGSAFMYYEASGSTTATASAISPAFDLSTIGADEAELTFYLHAFGSGIGNFEVNLSNDGVNFANILSWSGPIQAAQPDPFIKVGLDVTAYLGGNLYVEFKHTGIGNYEGDISIDLLEITSCVSCSSPTNLSAFAITDTTANLSWTENGSATTWNMEYGTTGFTQGTGTMASGTILNPYPLGGLTANTTYDFYVQSNCGGSTSNWSGPFTFTTLCSTINTFPFTEDFEATSLTRSCWTQIQEAGAADWTYNTGSSGGTITTANNGAENARFVSQSGTNSPITKLISPMFDISGMTNPQVSFWYGQEDWAGDQNELKVYYSNDNGVTWTEIAYYTGNVSAWTQETIPLPNASTTYQIAFEGINNYGRANVIDDVVLEETPSCPAPTALTASNITNTQAELAWTAGGSETVWNIESGPTGFTPTGTANNGGVSNPFTLTGLTAGTSYDYYVQSDCGGSTSGWSGPFTFITDQPGNTCDNPIVVNTLPYNTTDDTANYYDNYSGSPGTPDCGTTSNYLNGDDVVYAYTATSDTTVNFALSGISDAWTGMFVYTDCADIGVNCAIGNASGSSSADYNFDLDVVNGTTYYIVISSWPNPQSISYTLDISEITCPAPSGMTATTITNSGATLSWTENGTAIVWDLEIGVAGFVPTGTPTDDNVSNPYTWTGGAASTTYDVYYRSDCAGDNVTDASSWVGPISFATTPTNDDCINAELLLVGQVFADNEIITTNVGSTASGEIPNPGCSSFGSGQDVWYSIIVPASGHAIIETAANPGSSMSDTGMAIYRGTCGNLELIDCNDDIGGGNNFSRIEYYGTPDEVIFIRVFEFGNNTFDTFKISAYDGLCTGGTATWDGSAWVGGILPDNTKHVIIDGYYLTSIRGTIEACSLEITGSGTLIVYDAGTGNYTRVVNGILNNGIISVLQTGSLVQVNDLTGIGGTPTISTARVITTELLDENRFTYVGSPVQGQNTNGVFGWARQVWDFDESTQFWNYLGTGTTANTIMPAGVGYAVPPTVSNSGVGVTQQMDFNGVFNNGIVTRPLVLDVGTNEPTVPADDDDSTLVANPYPSGLDLIGTGGLIDSNTINNVLIWTHASALDPGATSGFAGDDYIVCSLGGCTNAPTGGSHTGIAATGQGFFVNAIVAGTLTFNNAMRVTTGNNQFRSPNTTQDKVWINLGNSLGYNSNILLAFTNNGSINFDTKYDAKKPLSTTFGTSFYSINGNNEKLAINDNGIFNDTITIPVGYIVNDAAVSDLSISITDIENLTDTNIYVIDHLLNITHDLKISDYNFTVNNTGENDTRFEIVFSRTALNVGNNNASNTNLIVSNFNENQVRVNMPDGSIITNLKAFDTLGKLVIDMDANSNDFILNKSFNQGQILILKATLENGQVLTNKFIKL